MDSANDLLVLEDPGELSSRLQIQVQNRIGGGSSGRVFQAIFDGSKCAAKVRPR